MLRVRLGYLHLHVLARPAFVQIFEFGNVQDGDEVDERARHVVVEDRERGSDVITVGGWAVGVLQRRMEHMFTW